MMPQFLRASCFALPLSREKAQHKRDIKIFYHYQEEFSINFHIFTHTKNTRVRFLCGSGCALLQKANKKGALARTNVRAKLPLRVLYFVLSGSHGKKQAALCCGDGTSRPCGGASSSPALPSSFDISFDRKQGDASILHSFVRVRPVASGSPQSLPSWKAPAPLPVPAPG